MSSSSTISEDSIFVVCSFFDESQTSQKLTIYNTLYNALYNETHNKLSVKIMYDSLLSIFQEAISGKTDIKIDIDNEDYNDICISIKSDIESFIENKKRKLNINDGLLKLIKITKISKSDLAYLFFTITENRDDLNIDIVKWNYNQFNLELKEDVFKGEELYEVIDDSQITIEQLVNALVYNHTDIIEYRNETFDNNEKEFMMLYVYPTNLDIEDIKCIYYLSDSKSSIYKSIATIKLLKPEEIELNFNLYNFKTGNTYYSHLLESNKLLLTKLKVQANKQKKRIVIDENDEEVICECWELESESDSSSSEDTDTNSDDLNSIINDVKEKLDI